MKRYHLFLLQLGSPQGPSPKEVRNFLRIFLGDPRVVDSLPPFLWKIILNLFILPFRPRQVAKAYQRLWNGSTFPLIELTQKFAHSLQDQLGDKFHVQALFLLSNPSLKDGLKDWENSRRKLALEEGAASEVKWIILPQFPQYSEATTASAVDMFLGGVKTSVHIPSFEMVNEYHRSKAFIDNSVRRIETQIGQNSSIGDLNSSRPAWDELILSFHGMPLRRITQKGDPYFQHCLETYDLIREKIRNFPREKIHMTFQSRFGGEDWLKPYTEEFILESMKRGSRRFLVYCPSFVVDCLETLQEIGFELKEKVVSLGGTLDLVPCLNDDPVWVKDYAHFIQTIACGSMEEKEELLYSGQTFANNQNEVKKEKDELMLMPFRSHAKTKLSPESEGEGLSSQAKRTLKILFLTLFLDLLGFTLLFPLFPSLAKYYLEVSSEDPLLKLIFSVISYWTSWGGGNNSITTIVLFGGILGALYSLLQFLFAPFWGKLSDRIGRRPILVFSLIGISLGHFIWVFAGSFSLLLLSRLISGVMSGNISTATAVVADVTTAKNRSKGMALIGIAFALGFILGPAIGGLLSLIDLTQINPSLTKWGINPFSVPALFAFSLAICNLSFLLTQFQETLPRLVSGEKGKPSSDEGHIVQRSINPLKLFRPFPFPGVNLTNFGHFLFLSIFSGMEFTLTFLAAERWQFTSLQNAYMFIYIGLIIVLIQGGVVRRKASQVGEKKMGLWGLTLIIPGLLLVGQSNTVISLYSGLLFLAVGSAMVIPCLTTLISLFTPSDRQGEVLGSFRSLGALARVLGPLAASLVYWRAGSSTPYLWGAILLLAPWVMVYRLPSPQNMDSKQSKV